MASTDNISIGKPLSIITTKPIDARFGPFTSVSEAYNTVGPNGSDNIYAGLIFCVIANNKVEFYKWTKTNNPTVNDVEKVIPTFKTVDGKEITGEGNISTNGIIPFAGVKESGTVISGTSPNEATSAEIYYFANPGVFGYSINGGTSYYKRWANEEEFGKFEIFDPNYTSGNYNGNLQGIVPFKNRLYLDCTTLEVKVGTDSDEFDNIGGTIPEFTEAQQDAIDSGITAEIVTQITTLLSTGLTAADITELQRLKALNITFDASTDKLTLTGKVNGEDTTKQYTLSDEGGGTITYGNPTIDISYPTLSASGGSYDPIISIIQKVYNNNVEDHTNTYTSIREILLAGGSIQFAWTNSSNKFDSLDTETGKIGADENLSGNNKQVSISVGVTLNKKSASDTIVVTQGTTSKLYIKEISYTTVDNGNGTYTATPTILASNNQQYSVSEYNAETKEAFSFGCNIANVINSSTGVITYSPSGLISNMTAGSVLPTMFVSVTQENTDHNISEIAYNWIDNTNLTTAVSMFGIRGAAGGGKIYKPGSQSYGMATATIENVSAGDTYIIETTAENPSYFYAWETKLKLINNSNGTGVIANSNKWSTDAATNYKTFVSDDNGWEASKYCGNTKRFVYKAIGNVSCLTFALFRAYSGDTISYKKLN